MDKKFIYLVGGGLLLTVILIVILVATSNQKPKTATNTAKSKVLTVWDYNNEKAAYDQLNSNFQTDNNIKINYVVKSADSYLTDTVNAIAAGNGPDVWIVPNTVMPQYHDKMVAMPTGSIANSSQKQSDLEVYFNTFPKEVYTDNIFNDQIYGIPIAIDNLKLFINTDLLNEKLQVYKRANPEFDATSIQRLINYGPANWDDFLKIIAFFSPKTNGKFAFSTAALGTTDNVPNYNDILTLLMMQNGAKMVADDFVTAQFHTAQNMFSSTSYPGTKALDFYTSFDNTKSPNYTWNATMPNAIEAFADGQTAMFFGYNKDINQVKRLQPSLNAQVFNVPQVKLTNNPVNIVQYDTLTIAKSSTNASLAWKYVLKATMSSYTNSYLSLSKKQAAANSGSDTNSPFASTQGWYNPDVIKVKQIFKNTIDQVNAGNNSQTAMDGAADQVSTLLAKLKQTQTQ